jgi:probable addiction module antidote protein
MAEVARRASVGDKTLFRALSENGNPTLDTVHKVLHAVGLRLSVVPGLVR